MTPRYQNIAYFLIHLAMHRMTALGMRDLIRTETTYDEATGRRLIDQILDDPEQKRQVLAMADAMVPALPRFSGVMNDLQVQQELGELPLGEVAAPTLIVGSRHDGDIGYANSVHSHQRDRRLGTDDGRPVRPPHLVGRDGNNAGDPAQNRVVPAAVPTQR
jgi:hypothetical protein